MSQKLATAFCVNLIIVTWAGSGHSAIVGLATLVKNPPGAPFNAPDAALPAPWISYQLSIVSTNPLELIGAVDVTINGNKLHQRWNDTDFDGVTNPSPNGVASNGRGDSHLTAPAGSPFGAGPSETNTFAGSPLVSTPGTTEYGLGNLSGAWGILNPSTSANIAYIVINSQEATPAFDIRIKAATPTGAPIYTDCGSDTLTSLNFCTGGVPPVAGDELIDNVNSAVPGFVDRQLNIQNFHIPLSLTNFVFDSFTPPPGGADAGPVNPATLDSATRKFNWNTIGSPIGTYKWTYTASNMWGADDGSITVNVTIPEPATFSLVGSAFIGLGFVRRRVAV